MRLHDFTEDFRDLITVVAGEKHISESAVERDYYIVLMLDKLANSIFANQCVFKGGTSLSKCYPGSIERFSEDIDLTFLGSDLNDKICEKAIKTIESIMSDGAKTEKIGSERSKRSKSMYIWFGNKDNKVKLEIGSTIRPDPYSKKKIKTYIQEYLEVHGLLDDVERFDLHEVTLNVLNIERTFIDKIMSVKRHAICGSLGNKVRHIYDVVRLWNMKEIKEFLKDTYELERLVELTKNTDSFYLNKRNIPVEYDPQGAYDFDKWKNCFNEIVKANYEDLHNELLYTDEKQDFDIAIKTFEEINNLLKTIGE